MVRLTSLNINDIPGLTDAGVGALASKCTALTELYARSAKLTDVGIASIVSIKTLQQLNLATSSELTDKSLQLLANNCPNLNLLNVNSAALTDEGKKNKVNEVHFQELCILLGKLRK